MDIKQEYKQLLNDSWQLIVEPKQFWMSRRDAVANANVFVRFFLPLVVLVGLAIFLGEWITSSEFLFSYAISKSIRDVVVYLLQFFAATYLTNELLTNFGANKHKAMVNAVVAYSLTPFLLVSIITGLFPALYVLETLSLYAIFLYGLGVKVCIEIPENNKTRFILISILVNFVTFALINLISWKILQAMFS